MSHNNKVSVTWDPPEGASKTTSCYTTRVTDLDGDAIVDDLRKALVSQQNLHVSPAALSVLETKGGEPLKASKGLEEYFSVVPPPGPAGLAGPGQDEDTALIIQFPTQAQPNG